LRNILKMSSSKKSEFLEKLADFNPSIKEIAETVEKLAGGSVEWIIKIIVKHHTEMIKEVLTEGEKKNASPFVITSIMAAVLQMNANHIKEFAKLAGEKELKMWCESHGITIEEIKDVLNNKETAEYIN